MMLVVGGWLGTRNATAHSTLFSVSIGQHRLGTVTLWQESIGWAGQRQGEGGVGTVTLWHSDRRALALGARVTRIDAVCGDPAWRSQAAPQNIFTTPYFTLFLPRPVQLSYGRDDKSPASPGRVSVLLCAPRPHNGCPCSHSWAAHCFDAALFAGSRWPWAGGLAVRYRPRHGQCSLSQSKWGLNNWKCEPLSKWGIGKNNKDIDCNQPEPAAWVWSLLITPGCRAAAVGNVGCFPNWAAKQNTEQNRSEQN